MNTIAMIPARMGSERLKMKNLALLDGRPLISYGIEAAKAAGVFDRIVINSDGEIFQNVAQEHGVEFYHRPPQLGSSDTKSDEVVYDFVLKHPCDLVAWVNPTSPLQTGDEIRSVVNFFIEEELDSLVTVEDERVHCVYEGHPINFTLDGLFAKTQDLTPVQSFVYSVMMWRCKTFMEAFDKRGYSLLSGKLGYFPVSKRASFIIKTDEDLMIAESILQATGGKKKYEVQYAELLAGDQ